MTFGIYLVHYQPCSQQIHTLIGEQREISSVSNLSGFSGAKTTNQCSLKSLRLHGNLFRREIIISYPWQASLGDNKFLLLSASITDCTAVMSKKIDCTVDKCMLTSEQKPPHIHS